MIEVLTGLHAHNNHPMLESSFRLRHQVFVDERKWENLRRQDKREVDQFDGPQAVYLLAFVDGILAGSQRLLPTLWPHLLSDVHAFLCDRKYERAVHVWEWTRLCIDPRYRSGQYKGRIASELTIAAVEWGLLHGVRDVVLEYDPIWIPRFRDMGFEVRPLGLPVEIDNEQVVAVQMHYDDATLSRLRASRGITTSILSYSEQERLRLTRYIA
jgi:acyl-homoserine lactone synthase